MVGKHRGLSLIRATNNLQLSLDWDMNEVQIKGTQAVLHRPELSEKEP